MSPVRLVIGVVLAGIAGYAIWAAAGSRLVRVLDHLTTGLDGNRPAPGWYSIDEGTDDASFSIDNRRWPVPSTWRLTEEPIGHVTLETPQGRLTLGKMLRAWSRGGGYKSYEFIPDSGDVVTLTRRRSRVSWPLPLSVSLLTGRRTASSARYVYDHLVWRKPDGRELEIVWRDEQRYLASDGWRDQLIPNLPVITLR
jgi:hypothetical protein